MGDVSNIFIFKEADIGSDVIFGFYGPHFHSIAFIADIRICLKPSHLTASIQVSCLCTFPAMNKCLITIDELKMYIFFLLSSLNKAKTALWSIETMFKTYQRKEDNIDVAADVFFRENAILAKLTERLHPYI